MHATVINPEGKFENWERTYLDELLKEPIEEVGQELVFENEQLRIWSITLHEGSCLPFHRHTNNYNWTSLTSGKAISRYENGEIKEFSYQKGDMAYYDHDTKGDLVHDLENIGSTTLKFVTVEYKK